MLELWELDACDQESKENRPMGVSRNSVILMTAETNMAADFGNMAAVHCYNHKN